MLDLFSSCFVSCIIMKTIPKGYLAALIAQGCRCLVKLNSLNIMPFTSHSWMFVLKSKEINEKLSLWFQSSFRKVHNRTHQKRKGPGALKPETSCILCHFIPLLLPKSLEL